MPTDKQKLTLPWLPEEPKAEFYPAMKMLDDKTKDHAMSTQLHKIAAQPLKAARAALAILVCLLPLCSPAQPIIQMTPFSTSLNATGQTAIDWRTALQVGNGTNWLVTNVTYLTNINPYAPASLTNVSLRWNVGDNDIIYQSLGTLVIGREGAGQYLMIGASGTLAGGRWEFPDQAPINYTGYAMADFSDVTNISASVGGIKVAQGTNVILVTNGSVVTIHATGTGGGGGGDVTSAQLVSATNNTLALASNIFQPSSSILTNLASDSSTNLTVKLSTASSHKATLNFKTFGSTDRLGLMDPDDSVYLKFNNGIEIYDPNNSTNLAASITSAGLFNGNGAGLTNIQGSNIVGTICASISGSFAGLNGGLTNSDGSPLLSGVQVTNAIAANTNINSQNVGTLVLSNVTASRVAYFSVDGTMTNLSAGTAGQALTSTGSSATWSNIPITGVLGITFDGGGSVITSATNYIVVPYHCSILSASMVSDVSTSAGIDVWQTNHTIGSAYTLPTSATKITSTTPPNIIADIGQDNTNLTGWITNFTSPSIFGFSVLSNSAATKITLTLKIQHN